MAPLSDFAEAGILNHLFRGAASIRQDTYYLALYTSATNDAGGGTEVSTGVWTNYAPEALDASAASSILAAAAAEGGGGHESETTAVVDFGVAAITGGPVEVTHIALRTASSGGSSVYHGALAASKIIQNGDPVSFPVGALAFGLR